MTRVERVKELERLGLEERRPRGTGGLSCWGMATSCPVLRHARGTGLRPKAELRLEKAELGSEGCCITYFSSRSGTEETPTRLVWAQCMCIWGWSGRPAGTGGGGPVGLLHVT